MTRRDHFAFLAMCALLSPASALAAGTKGKAFSWRALIARAQSLARQPWRAPEPRHHVHAIDYDAVGRIGYRPDKTLWRSDTKDAGVRFFPLSRYAQTPVEVSVVENGAALPFRYDPALFEASTPELTALLAESDGFAGFRAMNPGGIGDWLAFQGASYFRSAGPLNQYGLSARGLAINTSVPGISEEFPGFTHFWLERGSDDALIVYALLDSPSISGAYRFVNRKLEHSVVQDVSSMLFARKDIAQLGVAPLTSMFWYGEGSRPQAIDWRPEIHDSDGLALFTGGGERLWRPLVNPPRPTTSSFSDDGPRGFGLLQRDRSFDHYQDDGVFYQKRPSLWIEPQGNWGKGSVVLYELPTNREYEDNIVAFWTPASPVRRGQRLNFDYQLSWIATEPQPISVARAVDLWSGTAGRPAADPIPNARKIVMDFVGGDLDRYSRAEVRPELGLSSGKVIEAHAYPVQEATSRWRLIADIARGRDQTSDLRVFLKGGTTALTETVLYQVHWPDG